MTPITAIQQIPQNINRLVEIYRRQLEKPLQSYRQQLTQYRTVDTALSTLATKLRSLHSKANLLKDTKISSVWYSKTTTTTDPTIVTATASNEASATVYVVNSITQLAKSYIYLSNNYTKTGTEIVDNVGTGTKSFVMEINDTQTTISIDIAAGDTNETILKKIRDAIHKSGANAVVSITSQTQDYVRLNIQAKNTGTSNIVLIRDKTGTLANYIGIQNAVYIINSNTYSPTGTDIVNAEGTGMKTISISLKGKTDYRISITINPGDTNAAILTNLANAIETSSIGGYVTAQVVPDDDGNISLLIADNEVNDLLSIQDITGTLANTINIKTKQRQTITTSGYIYKDNQLNSLFKINEIEYERQTNEVSDIYYGVTFNLKNVSSTPVTIKVLSDYEKIKATIKSFIETYNDTLKWIKENTGIREIDTEKYEHGPLSPFYLYKNLPRKLREIMIEKVDTVTNKDYEYLFAIGITADDQGYLSISDEQKFKTALESDIENVSDLFATDGNWKTQKVGKAVELYNFIDEYVKRGGHINDSKDAVSDRIKSLDVRIKYTERRIEKKIDAYIRRLGWLQQLLAYQQSQYGILRQYYGLPGGT